MVCTFFGHRECHGLDAAELRNAIEDLIQQGTVDFLVGHQGQFDSTVQGCLKSLWAQHPHIQYRVVLAYLPTEKQNYGHMRHTMYPEIEGHPQFAIERRNKWMISQADSCICYVNHPWGGAYKFAKLAKRKGLTVINLGSTLL